MDTTSSFSRGLQAEQKAKQQASDLRGALEKIQVLETRLHPYDVAQVASIVGYAFHKAAQAYRALFQIPETDTSFTLPIAGKTFMEAGEQMLPYFLIGLHDAVAALPETQMQKVLLNNIKLVTDAIYKGSNLVQFMEMNDQQRTQSCLTCGDLVSPDIPSTFIGKLVEITDHKVFDAANFFAEKERTEPTLLDMPQQGPPQSCKPSQPPRTPRTGYK